MQAGGGVNQLTIALPGALAGCRGIRHGSTERVRGVDGSGCRLEAVPRGAILGVAVHGRLRGIHRDLVVVGADTVALGIRVGEDPGHQHFVWADADTGHGVGRRKRGLLDLREEVLRVAVERVGADHDQRIVRLRPDLGEVEGVETVGLRLFVRHHLHVNVPRGEIASVDRVMEVATVVVGIRSGDEFGLGSAHLNVALVRGEVILDPESLAGRVDPLVGVRAEARHLPPGPWQTAVAHEVGHLVGGLRREGPEVPLHVGVTQARARQALLGVDEVGKLEPVADEEHRGVVSDDVVVALRRVELHREAAHVAPGVRAALLARDAREALESFGRRARLEDRCLGVGRHVSGHSEGSERPTALGVHDALRDALPIELGKFLDQVTVVQCGHAVVSGGE